MWIAAQYAASKSIQHSTGQVLGQRNYDQLEWHLERLRRAAKLGKLRFLVGAGVGADYGLPDWQRLLIELMEKTGRMHPLSSRATFARIAPLLNEIIIDPLLQAEAARGAFARPSRWLAALKQCLESNAPEDTGPTTLTRIAALTAQQYREDPSRHVPVLTFNYDDLLERALRREAGTGVTIETVTSGRQMNANRTRAGIFVYHLHGSIERPDDGVMLDMGSYVELLRDPESHWSWHCMDSFLYGGADVGVMLIGLSLTDPSVRLLLSRSAAEGQPLSGVFVTKPFPRIAAAAPPDLQFERRLAWLTRDIQTLFDEMLQCLQLVPYHVGDWAEVADLLERVTP